MVKMNKRELTYLVTLFGAKKMIIGHSIALGMLTAQNFTRDNQAHTNIMVAFFICSLAWKEMNRGLRNNSLKTSTVTPIFFFYYC